ncbi:hypothetical protein BDZ91DRAFT_802502 [Kalaharituber pfeilii]|nr:hypothetical protein BDZ91DRAFT_802502 [Kalaharituber pfeilii]
MTGTPVATSSEVVERSTHGARRAGGFAWFLAYKILFGTTGTVVADPTARDEANAREAKAAIGMGMFHVTYQPVCISAGWWFS